MKKYIAELIGTFALIFCGTGAMIIDVETSGMVSHEGVAIIWGLIVTAMIYTFGNISGAHFNPAVTLAFWVAKVFPAKEILPYLLSQALGAFLASIILHFLFPNSDTLGASLPKGSAVQSFLLELFITFFLMLTIIYLSQGSKVQKAFAGVAIGGVVFLAALFAGPICGASMNPIRSLSPAFVSRHLEYVWVYLTAPIIGAILSVVVWRFLKE
jgi:aquaporin NIP